MARRYIGDIVFAKVYPLLVAKAEKKGAGRGHGAPVHALVTAGRQGLSPARAAPVRSFDEE